MSSRIKIAGFGGQGVMFMGQLLGYTAARLGTHATYYPSYGPEMRGGTANCTVVISDETIGSPIPKEIDVLIAMNEPSLRKFQDDVTKGGSIIVNTSIIKCHIQRTDINIIEVKANDIATEIGSSKVSNMVALGTFLGQSEVFSPDEVMDTMMEKLPNKAKFFDLNKKALELGKAVV